MSAIFQQLPTAFIEQAVYISSTGIGLVSTISIQPGQFATVVLELDVWRVANYYIERAIVKAEHPPWIEEFADRILVVWIPCGKKFRILRIFGKTFMFCQKFGKGVTQFLILSTQFCFLLGGLGKEMLVPHFFEGNFGVLNV